jgi:hypothetical protein
MLRASQTLQPAPASSAANPNPAMSFCAEAMRGASSGATPLPAMFWRQAMPATSPVAINSNTIPNAAPSWALIFQLRMCFSMTAADAGPVARDIGSAALKLEGSDPGVNPGFENLCCFGMQKAPSC